MSTNPLVEFLSSYGPQASSNNLYDEFVVKAAVDIGCEPLEIEQPLVNELTTMLMSKIPRSVILTGTAGDGKTYTARKVVEAIAGPDAGWQTTDKIFDLSVPSCPGGRIRFIKDLSELKEVDKATLFSQVKASLLGNGFDIFVICVNDGHLLKFFRDRGAEGVKLHDRIADMLQNDEEYDPNGNFRLINMSRQSHRDLFERILDAIVDHPGWANCNGCHALDSAEHPCPIRANLEILRQKDSASMRARLKDMIRMAASDRQHLSIRQLILLTVNTLLGDQKPGKELLTCKKAKKRAAEDDYCATNPYANAFGQNLRERQRRQYGAFAVLEEFGIGLETNNFFDHSLLWDIDELPNDSIYGARIFASHRERYRIDPSANAQGFRREMLDQRRRLFFSIDPGDKVVREDPRRNPWNLSVFKYVATYIRLADGAEQGAVPRDIARDIIRGLNRLMTGEMTSTDDRLWLTEPSGVYLGRQIPLLVAYAGRQREGPTFITFPLMQRNGQAPVLRFTPMQRSELAVDLPLRPTLVECILRIANGALPASFSSECRRDIERFQLKAVARIHEACRPHHPPPQEVEMVGGTLQSRPIAALLEEDSW